MSSSAEKGRLLISEDVGKAQIQGPVLLKAELGDGSQSSSPEGRYEMMAQIQGLSEVAESVSHWSALQGEGQCSLLSFQMHIN